MLDKCPSPSTKQDICRTSREVQSLRSSGSYLLDGSSHDELIGSIIFIIRRENMNGFVRSLNDRTLRRLHLSAGQ